MRQSLSSKKARTAGKGGRHGPWKGLAPKFYQGRHQIRKGFDEYRTTKAASEVPEDIELPELPDVPQAVEQDPPKSDPMFSTDDDWETATIKLMKVKNYDS